MPCLRTRALWLAASFLLFQTAALPTARAQVSAPSLTPTATLRGRVLDLQTGEPLAHATISLGEGLPHTSTDEQGNFTLTGVPSPGVELRAFSLGYGMLRRHVDVAPGNTLELEIRLGQASLRDVQQITVNAGPFDPVVPEAPAQYTMNAREIEDLSTLLAHDPLRAVGSLPGVQANDEFYATFTVRGADPAHIGLFVDGVLVDRIAYGLEDSGNIGSLSVVNQDVTQSMSLLNGNFPPGYGDRTGAVLDFVTRDGAHDRIVTRALADMLGATVTSEGPFRKTRDASWLVSGRQSYLGYMLERLGVSNGLTNNYDDLTAKLSGSVMEHHHASLLASFGGATAEQSPYNTGGQAATFFTTGASQHGMGLAQWGWTPTPSALLATQASLTYDHEHDTNQANAVDLDTTSNVWGTRSTLTVAAKAGNRFLAGAEMRTPYQQRTSFTQWNYPAHMLETTLLPLDAYTARVWQAGAFAEDTHSFAHGHIALTAGVRASYFTPVGETLWLPDASAAVNAGHGTTLTFAWGQYAQMPNLTQLEGAFGNPALHAERATHEMAAVDQQINEKTRVHVEVYNRQEHGDIYSPLSEFHLLANGQVSFPVLGPVLQNSLKSYARGVEIMLQRRSANRLSGWISYARSYSKYWQPGTTLSFAGNDDQRDTFSAYGAWHLTRTWSFSGNVRYGSGTPVPGFFAPSSIGSNGSFVTDLLSTTRNALREEPYFDSSVRANKVFTARRFNFTVSGEIINLTSHTNYRYYDFVYVGNIATSKQVATRRNSTLPFLPVAGITFEF